MIEGITPHIPSITPDTMSLPDEYEGQYKEKRKHRMRRALPRVAGAILGLGLLAAIYQPYKPAPLPIDNPPSPHVLEHDANIRRQNDAVINFVVQNFDIVDTASAQEPEDDVQVQIVGGTPVEAGKWPFMVALFHTGHLPEDDQYCGAVLLNNQQGFTAGHCTSQETAEQISIFTGIDLRDPGSGEIVQVLEVHRLPCFDDEWDTCDFAIFKLTRPVTTIDDFAIVAPGIPDPGTDVTIMGWGDIYYNGPRSKVLLEVQEQMLSRAECKARHPNWFTEDMVCSINRAGGRGACNGDSGGPAMIGENILVAVHSWGVKCAWPNEPDYFSAVQINYLDWLLSITGVPVFGITGNIDENTGEFSFTAQSPYPGRIPDTPATWIIESRNGWSLTHGPGLTWSGVVTHSLGTQVITITATQQNKVRTRRTIIINPVGVVYLPVILN